MTRSRTSGAIMADLNDPRLGFLRDDRVFLLDLYDQDQVDPRLPWSFPGPRERARLAGALRQLADLFISRPDLPLPKDGYARLEVIAGDGRRVAEIVHGPGGYRFRVLLGAFEQPGIQEAPRIAAADLPAVPASCRTAVPSPAWRRPQGAVPAKQAIQGVRR